MFNNNNSNNPSGGKSSSFNAGLGGGDFGGAGGHGPGGGHGSSDDPMNMNNMYGVGNDMSNAAAARFGMGGGSDMMGMNAMGNMSSNMSSNMGGMTGMGSLGGMANMGGGMPSGMSNMGGMGMGNMPANMPSRIENIGMLYRAQEKQQMMMNARRSAFLRGGEDKFGGMGMGMGDPSFMGDVPPGSIGGNINSNVNANVDNVAGMNMNMSMKRRIQADDAARLSDLPAKGKKRRKTKKATDMPRRALSAYNIFFSDQREKILKEIDDKNAAKKNKDDQESADSDKASPSKGTENKKANLEGESSDQEAIDDIDTSSEKAAREDKTDDSETEVHGIKVKKEDTEGGSQKDEKGSDDDETKEIKKNPTDDDDDNEDKKTKAVKRGTDPKVMYRTFFPTRAKRAHRKVHGKIGLVDLAREVSRRWKSLDSENRAHYESLAEEDRKRHKEVMAEYQERKAAENMLTMGGKGDEEENDRKSNDRSSLDLNSASQSQQDIRETITHHHQQRILAEMIARRGNSLSGRGSNFPMMSNRFGGSMGNQSMGGISEDMQSILNLQNQRAMMIQARMRMSGGMGGMGMDNMEGMGGPGMGGSGMGGPGMGGSGMGGPGMGGSGMGGPGMGGPGMGGSGMSGGMGGMGGGMGPSF
eukprot:CAMPEP_0168217154 /NCGR_PEP_ID=MMETSP0140_2-20121125/7082_1 /TAXON_ID=44445 /ORGANISM="Pseudo-nitzschia australis, Strain 10249 10 AB" /LENGTH=642 /DNA_ID=CAMNT_0008144863 /DNA_START=246 /DNA_END=2174 /DNA_ORIENTATION=-